MLRGVKKYIHEIAGPKPPSVRDAMAGFESDHYDGPYAADMMEKHHRDVVQAWRKGVAIAVVGFAIEKTIDIFKRVDEVRVAGRMAAHVPAPEEMN